LGILFGRVVVDPNKILEISLRNFGYQVILLVRGDKV